MINQQEWLRTRKNLLDQVKSQVQLRLGRPAPALRQYAKNLDAEFKGVWRTANEAEFLRALQSARVILSGDFHAYAQSQRAHLRILRDWLPDRPLVLALECLPRNRQKAIDAFLSGTISESRFLREVDWERNWGFPWEHYRPLFELARDRGFKIVGLNDPSHTGLKARDENMARLIARVHAGQADAIIYVVVGEWHLADRHLPRKIRAKMDGEPVLVLFQDVEPLYFRQAKLEPKSMAEFLRGRGNRFCIMVSPPWMKWQSYLMYLEQAYDRDLQEDLGVDYSDHVASLVELLENDLKIQTNRSRLQVYCPNSRSSLKRLRAALSSRFAKVLFYHLEHDLSFLLPEKDLLYLSRPTINHASTLAGQFVHAHLAGRRRALWNFPQDFVALVWIEAIGFFFSKWINPKRKAENWDSIRLRLEAASPQDKGRMALLLALDHRLSEVVWLQTRRVRRPRYQPKNPGAFIEASRLAGEMFGEKLFQKVRSKRIPWTRLLPYLKVNVDHPDFAKSYWRLLGEIESEDKA